LALKQQFAKCAFAPSVHRQIDYQAGHADIADDVSDGRDNAVQARAEGLGCPIDGGRQLNASHGTKIPLVNKQLVNVISG
jgi:hypothetical protein